MSLTLAFAVAAIADLAGSSKTRGFTRAGFGVVVAAEIVPGVASAAVSAGQVLGGLI